MRITRALRKINLGNGANSFVHKPLDFTPFADTVVRLGLYWVATNQPPHD